MILDITNNNDCDNVEIDAYYEGAILKGIEALDKQKAVQLLGDKDNPIYIEETVSGLCPICLEKFICITPMMYKANGYGYCKKCGQKIKW